MNTRLTLQDCDTLMLDMDGTLLDLAFDNFMWLQHIPAEYGRKRGLEHDEALRQIYAHYQRLRGQLDWYCLDHWSELLDLDVVGLHRAERARIGWLPGAEAFLEAVQQTGQRVLLVTNSHPDTLAVKSEVTGIEQYFSEIYTSHQFGHPKEDQEFWRALARAEEFDPSGTIFVDDNEAVLSRAQEYGLHNIVRVTRPDTTRDILRCERFATVEGVKELLPAT